MLVSPASLKTIRFGHSPDADDAFMFYGFHTGHATISGCQVEHVLEDIQSLNRRALDRADLEITAVSAHAYAHLADRYAVLRCGASMGMGYGPIVVARERRSLASLRGRSVAVPGPLTTSALLLAIECPESVPLQLAFDRIPAVVLDGAVEAGVLIHEGQLTYADEGLIKVADFGELWRDREQLPLPLGLDVVRRDLGEQRMREVREGFEASIRYALAHEDEALAYALGFGRGLDTERGRRFVRMYVNELTLEMGATGRRALERLYELAVKAQAIPEAPPLDVV